MERKMTKAEAQRIVYKYETTPSDLLVYNAYALYQQALDVLND